MFRCVVRNGYLNMLQYYGCNTTLSAKIVQYVRLIGKIINISTVRFFKGKIAINRFYAIDFNERRFERLD